MLYWRLPPPVRSLLLSSLRNHSFARPSSTTSRRLFTQPSGGLDRNHDPHRKLADPLRILFCGADEFSAESLRSLDKYRRSGTSVESIEVVHRPGKRAGRGLKEIREVPIKHVATQELGLPTHEIDTFTKWTPPSPYNLIIAVSFGLFVPPRILNSAQYGGLNVHPSLLPDLYGPAPIHHALMKQREYTGVSVQTLHPKHFDRGTILAQTPAPGIHFPPSTDFEGMAKQLGVLGGQMLVDVLERRLFVPPLENVGWYGSSEGPIEHAEKITKKHSHVDFDTATASGILAAHLALGDLWCNLPNGERVVLNKVVRAQGADIAGVEHSGPGLFLNFDQSRLLARAADGKIVQIVQCTVAGGKKGGGFQHVRRVLG